MAITYVDSVNVAANNPTAWSWALPAGWVQDDFALFWLHSVTGAKTITEPGTVTQRYDNGADAGVGRTWIGYRILQTGDTTFAFTASSNSNSTTIYGTSVFRGVDITTPFDVADPGQITSTAVPFTVVDVPDIVTVSDDCMIVCFAGAGDDTTSNPPTAPSIDGSAGTLDNSGAGGNSWGSSTTGTDASCAVAWRVAAGAGGSKTCTSFGMAIANGGVRGLTFALRPAVAAAAVPRYGFVNHVDPGVL